MNDTKRPFVPGGSRVFLRAPAVGDRDELAALGKASRRLHHPWLSAPSMLEAVDRWLDRLGSDRFESFVVCRCVDGAVVGVLNLSEIVLGSFRSAYSSYWAYAGYSGQGYMTEGFELLLRHVFGTMRLHRLEANIQPENEASIALVRRVGFRREGFSPRYLKVGGRWRDHERWAITREDWLARRVRSSAAAKPRSA